MYINIKIKEKLKKIKNIIKKNLYSYMWKLSKKEKKYIVNDNRNARSFLESISKKPLEEYPEYLERCRVNEFDLSIIIPVYNVEKYLTQCLSSILAQKTKYSFEVIIVDDGSTDNSSKILKDFYSNIKNWRIITQCNGGLSAARNTGLKYAKGKYIMFIDSDDFILEFCIDNLMNRAIQENLDIVQVGYDYYMEGVIVESEKNYPSNSKLESYDDLKKLPGLAWGKVYKRELFNDVEFPVGYWFEDSIIHYDILPKCKSALAIDYVGYMYRNNPKGICSSAKKSNRAIETYWVIESIINKRKIKNKEITMDIYLFSLWQLSVMNYQRILWMDDKVKESIFILSSELVENMKEQLILNGKYVEIEDDDLNVLERAYLERNIKIWKSYSRFKS